ncbi:MAG: hypothetical protein JXR07_17150 [Reichenbachiella sp.]
MKNIYIISLIVLLSLTKAWAQSDSTEYMNLEAIFNRPFVLNANNGKSSAAIGGYIEGNTNYFETDGISADGFGMELRRFNIFIYATVHDRIKFISELEFEHGTEEIALETALVDFEIHPAFVFRMGILLPPIGYFNQNHDSPKWEFIDRPLVSTQIIPSTLSEMGLGFYGKVPLKRNMITYELYLVNGLGPGIIENESNRTLLDEGKRPEMFGGDNNGIPSITGRLAFKSNTIGEFGVSGYTGIYNNFEIDGIDVDEKRRVSLFALDYQMQISKLKIVGETAWSFIDIPANYGQQFGNQQFGTHLDLIYPVWNTTMFDWKNVVLNLIHRTEFADYNQGTFETNDENIYDQVFSIMPGMSLRFSANTLLRLNYRMAWERDILGNPASKTAGIQFGFATYF